MKGKKKPIIGRDRTKLLLVKIVVLCWNRVTSKKKREGLLPDNFAIFLGKHVPVVQGQRSFLRENF